MEDNPDEEHVVKIINVQKVTHDVKRFTLTRPQNYTFKPGQATDITINHPDWITARRPFTFTGLTDWDTLEFTIKIYDGKHGVTSQLGKLHPGDELILHDVFGAITYQGEGTFIAGGAGVTPFIAIFRELEREGKIGGNELYFSNKTESDIILKSEFRKMLGKGFLNILSQEENPQYEHGIIDETFLRKHCDDLNRFFYICGPDPMIDAIADHLAGMGVAEEKIIREEF